MSRIRYQNGGDQSVKHHEVIYRGLIGSHMKAKAKKQKRSRSGMSPLFANECDHAMNHQRPRQLVGQGRASLWSILRIQSLPLGMSGLLLQLRSGLFQARAWKKD